MKSLAASVNGRPLTARRLGRSLFAIVAAISVALCMGSWVAHERFSLRREQEAKKILEHEYGASAIGPLSSDADGSGRKYDEQYIDLRELSQGRLYTPIDLVVFNQGTSVDNRALEQLASFRYLESLDFVQCRIEPDAEFCSPRTSCLKRLGLDRTRITTSQLRSLSQLRRLEGLTLDAGGLKGDFLEPLCRLPRLAELYVTDGDFSQGAAASLARMQGIQWLYLCKCSVDAKVGPALGRLENLEFLDVYDAPFDDEGVKHLTSLKHLTDLRLGRTAITDDCMASLAQLTGLTKLELSETKIGDAGLQHLRSLPKLETLDIPATRVTNACLPTLAAMPSLKVAHVGDTAVKQTSPGFIGILDEEIGYWYPTEAARRQVEDDGTRELD